MLPTSWIEYPSVFNSFSVAAYDSGWTVVLSSGFSESLTFMNPAHCSYAFGPSFLTLRSSFLEENLPFSSLYETIFFAIDFEIPETCSISETDAVFTSTPTSLTDFSTTWSSDSDSFFWFMSCWYWPTPMDFGSIFTSSARGS